MFRNTYSEEKLQTAAPASYPRVPTLGSHYRVPLEGPTLGSHLRVQGPTFQYVFYLAGVG